MKRICILGGGFGGLYTALELSRLPWQTPPQITLVDRQERFVFLPLLYELLTSEMEDWEVAPRFRDLLADVAAQPGTVPIEFHQAAVRWIDIQGRQIHLEDEQILEYDYVVLAMGGDTPLGVVPGAADYAIPFRHLADVVRLRQALSEWEHQPVDQPIRLAVAGGGASGVELACKLADRVGDRGRVRLIERGSEILGAFTDASLKAAKQALAQRQVQVELNTEVICIEKEQIQTRHLLSREETTSPAEGVIWTVGLEVVPVIQALALSKDGRGRLQVLPTLQTVDHPEIFALGDLAAVVDADGAVVPASAQAAFQQASYCAWNLWALITASRPLLPFRYNALGEMLSLGMDTAVLSGLGITLDGPLGYLARRLVYLVRMPTLDHQLRVGWNWITRPAWMEVERWLKPS